MIVTHDRPILTRADDSVMSVIDGAPAFIRRSRGFVPEPIDLGDDGPPVLAVGAHLRATLCITRGREAFLSQHVGDLGSAQTLRSYFETARGMLAMLDVVPELVACDLHPDYRSTAFAEATGLPLLRVQHHVAHLAAVAAEHKLAGPVFGVALDGHGYGRGRRCVGRRAYRARWRVIGAGTGTCCRSRCRAATAPRASRGAWAWPLWSRSAAARKPRKSFPTSLARRAWRPFWHRQPDQPGDQQHGPTVRRRRCAAGGVHAPKLRGPGGHGT